MKKTRLAWLVLVLAISLLASTSIAYADTYTDVSSNFPALGSVDAITYNGNGTWMLGGYGTGAGLYSWDGVNAPTDLSANLTGMTGVDEIGWNGSYWMVGGTGTTPTGRLFKDNGGTFSNIVTNTSVNSFAGIAANGSNWLVGGRKFGGGVPQVVASYDGATYSDIVGFNPMSAISSIATNGSVWLMGSNVGGPTYTDFLYSYDGTTITNLSSQLGDMTYVNDIDWNGLYWLIAGSNNADPREARLFAYNGTMFSDLSTQVIAVRNMDRIRSIATNGPVWLLGGDNSSNTRFLVKYDGTTFTDLSSNISGLNAIGSIATNGSKWLVGTHWSGGASKVWQVVLSPVVTSPSPFFAPPVDSPTLTINGQNFGPETTVKLVMAGQPDILGTGVTVLNGGALTATFNLQGAALGPWDIVVTTDGGETTLAGGFTVGFAPAELPFTGR